MSSAWPNLEPKQVGQPVRAVHPYTAGRYPDGVVVMADRDALAGSDDDRTTVTVQVGLGSTVSGPARHWQLIATTAARLEWLEQSEETLASLARAGVDPGRLAAMRRTADAIRARLEA